MKKKNSTTKFDRIFFTNKWKNRHHYNSGLIFGILEHWAGPCDYCYKFAVFRFEISFWFKITYNK